MADALLGFFAHPRVAITPYILRLDPFAPDQSSTAFAFLFCFSLSRESAPPVVRPANFGGISIIALLMRTATGFRLLACALEAEALGLERDRATPGKWVVEGRQSFRIEERLGLADDPC